MFNRFLNSDLYKSSGKTIIAEMLEVTRVWYDPVGKATQDFDLQSIWSEFFVEYKKQLKNSMIRILCIFFVQDQE